MDDLKVQNAKYEDEVAQIKSSSSSRAAKTSGYAATIDALMSQMAQQQQLKDDVKGDE